MRILMVLALSLLVACASKPPEYSTYLLRSDKSLDSRPLMLTNDIYLGAINVASYIDQPGLVLDLGEGKMNVAKFNVWAEPLRVSLRPLISSEISTQLGFDVSQYPQSNKQGRRVDITIDQLHGNDKGQAVLVALWTITEGDIVSSYRFAETVMLKEDGYDALVAAEKSLLQQLAVAISGALKKSG